MGNPLRKFVSNESGAVTVDHVVLTAAMVGLGIATLGTVSGGLETTSASVSTHLGSDIINTRFFRAATSGLTGTYSFSVEDTFRSFSNATKMSFHMDVTLNSEDEGILFEAGGRSRGTILYQHDGKLYLQAGGGSNTGEASGRGEAVWDVTEGTHTIEGSLDASTGLALYVDGKKVSQSSFTTSVLAGGDRGAVGTGRDAVAVNRGGFTEADGHPGAGTLTLFEDQTIGDDLGT